MSIVSTLLVYAAAPLAIVLVVALMIYLPGGRSRRRYKPGQPWEHPPVWYEPHPEHGPAAGHGSADGHGERADALGSSVYTELQGSSPSRRIGDSSSPARAALPAGGDGAAHGATAASAAGHGATHGATAASAQHIPGGPLGGARGTW